MKEINGNPLIMKKINTNIVRNVLKKAGQSTKQQLAQSTGLSAVTIGTILQQLVLTNEVCEDERIPSNGGRPSQTFCYNSEYAHILILYTHDYYGEDKIYIRVVNLLGEPVYKHKMPAVHINLHSFEPTIAELLDRFPTIKAIGFGLPMVEHSQVVTMSDYKELFGMRFSEHYASCFHLPVVTENDVNAAAAGYCFGHETVESAAVVYIYFPLKNPPGAGICINRRIYKGHTGFAGEVKKIPFHIDWDHMDYEEFDLTCDAIAKLITAIVSVLDPAQVILCGHFLTDGHIRAIHWSCEQALPEIIMPSIVCSCDFHTDYEKGLIGSTLDLIKEKLTLTN